MAEGDRVELPPPKTRGPKYLQLDEDNVFDLASMGCTQEEMARLLKCSVDTLHRNYAEIIKDGQASLDVSVRRALVIEGIHKRSFPALKLLAQNRLGYSDKVASTLDATLTLKDETQEKINAMAEQLDQMLGELSQPVVVSLPKGLLPDQQS